MDFLLQFFKMCIALFVSMHLSALFDNNGHAASAQPVSILKVSPNATQLSTSITTRAKLFSKTRMFLQIDQNGQVGGTVNCNDQYSKLTIMFRKLRLSSNSASNPMTFWIFNVLLCWSI